MRVPLRLLGILLLLGMAGAVLAVPPFSAYRDLAIYTTSAPAPDTPSTIVAVTQIVNRGTRELPLKAFLKPVTTLGFAGASFSARLQPGTSTTWRWTFNPPDGFFRAQVTGSVVLHGRTERELYLTILGADPPEMTSTAVDKITERARVVATYAPRARTSILAQLAQERAHRPAPVLTLAAQGKTTCSIQVDALPAPSGPDPLATWRALSTLNEAQRDLLPALDDLQRAVRLQSGATLPFRAVGDGPAIRLRLVDPGSRATGLQDAYRLRVTRNGVLIEAQTPDGLRNGIYGLLTDHLDCHWFMPGQLGEEIGLPADHAVRLPALDEVRGAPWLSAYGNVRNRAMVNRGRINFGHAWHTFINVNEYPYETFPQYYARDRDGNIRKILNPGETFTNFCSTDPEVIEIVAKKVNAYFAAHPDAIVASLDPNDYAPMCLCDRCLALDKQYGQMREDGKEVSDRLLHFSNEIYTRLEPRFKDRYLGILIYAYQMSPPISAKAHVHHVGTICDMFWVYDHTRPWNDPTSTKNQVFQRQLLAWSKSVQQLGYYEYTGNAEFFGPWALVNKIREDMPAFRELGGTFLIPEAQAFWGTQALNLYISDRLTWDLHADVDLLLEEFFTRFYGPAAEPMRAYWMATERLYATERPGSRPDRRLFAGPEAWAELDGYLRQAQERTAHLPAAQQRFADRVQFARDALEYGRLMTEYQDSQRKRPVDHAAALAFLQAHGPRLTEITGRYGAGTDYWPPLAPGWALGEYDLARLTAVHRQALSTATPAP